MYHNNVTDLIHIHFQITLLCLNPLQVSGDKRPSSGGTTLAVFGVSCVHLQPANSYSARNSPKTASVVPPEDGRLTPETCR
jgi:hypothetical protein